MISVIICTRDDEARLLRSLAALAPFAAEGFIGDVIIADRGSRDATLAVADAAGCTIIENCSDIGAAVGLATKLARKDWLLGLVPGDIADEAVMLSTRRHMMQAEQAGARREAAFLALPAGAGLLRRAAMSLAFDLFGSSAPQARRALAPRAQAHLLVAAGRRWPGVRLKERIEGSE